ncbi:hypothetical protein A5654_11660 [Mycolicibacterium fortuitum]|nr:hypothetical protein A5654_11660 [Mycolicibacterium fortuitum]
MLETLLRDRADAPAREPLLIARRVASPQVFSVLENQRVYNEVRVPFSLDDLPEGESIALHDVDGFIPYLTERWPEGGRPDRVEISGPGAPRGVDGYIVFRLPPPEREATGETYDWEKLRPNPEM